MIISVIIPAHNRPEKISDCLKLFAKQKISKELFELIIIDDGSVVDLYPIINNILNGKGVKFSYLKQHKSGPAAARNKGIERASGDIILFTGDDIQITPDFLSEHYNFHQVNNSNNEAMLGRIAWPKDAAINDFMRWLEISGFQFRYDDLTIGQEADYRYFYTNNISLKKSFLLKHGLFDTIFPYAAFEDTELGYRLGLAGLKLIYNPNALAFHNHVMHFSDGFKRWQMIGYSAKIFVSLHPELTNVYSLKKYMTRNDLLRLHLKNILKHILYPIAKLINNNNKIVHSYWRMKLELGYIKGYREAHEKNFIINRI